MSSLFVYTFLTLVTSCVVRGSYTVEELRCEICKSIVREMEDIITKVSSTALANVGSHRIDEKGNLMSKVIPLVESESFLIETMESACDKMQDYARGYDKKTRKFRVVKMKEGDVLMAEMTEINPISDVDLNESLRFYCEEITDEHETDIFRVFKTESFNRTEKLCTEETRLCQHKVTYKTEL